MFVPWWPNLLTSRESLSLLGSSASDDETRRALDWFLLGGLLTGSWITKEATDSGIPTTTRPAVVSQTR
jgi:hypothetical protein